MTDTGTAQSVTGSERWLQWFPSLVLFLSIVAFWQGDFFYGKVSVMLLGLAVLALAGSRQVLANVLDKRFLSAFAVVLVIYIGSLWLLGRGSRTVEQLIWWGGVFATLAVTGGGTRFVLPGLTTGILLTSLFGILQWAGVIPANFDAYGQIDPASLFGLSNFSAEFLAPLVPLLWVRRTSFSSRWMRGLISVTTVLAVVYIVVAHSRAGWLGLGIGISVMLFYGSRRMRIVSVVTVLLSLGIVAGALRRPGASDSFRLEGQKTALQMVIENPLGVGPGWFADYADSYLPEAARKRQERTLHRMMDPHDELLRVLAEFGWGGALVFVGLILFWLTSLQAYRREKDDASLLAGALAFLAIAFVSTPGRTASGMLVLGLLFGMQKAPDFSTKPKAVYWRIPVVMVVLAMLAFGARLSRAEQAFRTGLALINFEKGPRYNRARMAFAEALKFDGGHRSARLGYVKSLFGLNQWQLAFRAALPLLSSGSPPDSLLRLVVFAGVRAGDPKDLIALLNRYQVRIFNWQIMDLMALGQELLRAGMPQAAAELLDQPRVRKKNEGILLLSLARLNAGQAKQVVQLLKDDPRRETILEVAITLALAYEKLQRYHEAERVLREIDSKFPGETKAVLYLARDLWQQQDRQGAMEQIAIALRRDRTLTLDPSSETDPVFRRLYNYVVEQKMKGLRKKSAN